MTQALVDHAKKAIEDAFANKSKLPDEILDIPGMSGNKTRHLYNNMCSLSNCNYLEIGTYKGSSFISAMYGNDTCEGYCVDHWKEFGGKKEFFNNLSTFLKDLPSDNLHVLDTDCWTITRNNIPCSIDIYMYDGAHTYEDQKRAITHFAPFLSKYSIIMVDDWVCDWVHVKQGTMDGIAEANLKVHFSEEIGLVNAKAYHHGGDTFWNGCGVFVCERTDI